jgi:phosphate transport system permease protein
MEMRKERDSPSKSRVAGRPPFVIFVAILLLVASIGSIAGSVFLYTRPAEKESAAESVIVEEAQPTTEEGATSPGLDTLLIGIVGAGAFLALAWGMWTRRNWALSGTTWLLLLGVLAFLVTVMFDVAAEVFAGEQVMPVSEIFKALIAATLKALAVCVIPVAILYGLRQYNAYFEESVTQRNVADRSVRYILLATALSSIFIVFLIILFTFSESMEAIQKIGLDTMLLGTIWRPGSIIGTNEAQFGLVPMIIGSILSTFGAVVLGVPLSIGTAILLAEVAPHAVREFVRPAIELLAGIPSVVYGLFGMVVLAPLIRKVEVPYNSGFGLLNASIILAVMIIPTVTNIAEDAIRAVPDHYKQASLALGATHWQTIWSVILPAARSGIVAAVILGIGRALGETMALIMVIGNAIAIPEPLNNNPLTIFLSAARTLTGNIAVEINYAAGPHRSALFFTGLLLFVMIFLVNSLARYLMRERLSS